MGLLDYIKANTPRSTRPRVSPATVINQGLLNPNQFNKPQADRFKDSLFGMMGIVPGVGDAASVAESADLFNRGENFAGSMAALGALPFVPALGGVIKNIKPTKYQIAQDEARKKAVEMLGLPESNTAMDRAKALGYNTKLFHETTGENVEKLGAFNPRTPVAAATDEQTPYAIFLKRTGENIGVARDNQAQMPLLVREGNQASYRNRDSLQDHVMYDENARNAIKEAQYYDQIEMKKRFDDAMNNSDKFAKEGNRRLSDEYMDNMQSILDEWDKGNKQRAAVSKDAITDFFRKEGYDSARIYDDAGSGNRHVDTTMVFDPKNIRSIFAAFDPSKTDSADIMAGIAPYLGVGGLLGLGMYGREDDTTY